MRTLFRASLVVLVLTTSLAQAAPDGGPGGPPFDDTTLVATRVAGEAVRDFIGGLTNEEDARRMGFERVPTLDQVVVQPPLRQYAIGLQDLKNYVPGSDVEPIMKARDEFIFPLAVGRLGAVRSSITVQRIDNVWKAVEFGDASFIQTVAKIRDLRRAQTPPGTVFFLARVPALNAVFIGNRVGTALFFTPIRDNSAFRYTAGSALTAADALAPLLTLAAKHRGNPT